MRTVGSALVGLCLSGSLAAQDPTWRVESYAFNVSLPDTGRSIVARATIILSSRRWPDTVFLDLTGMTVDSMCVRSTDACSAFPFRYDGRRIALTMGRGEPEAVIFTIYYHGTPTDGFIVGPNARGKRVAFADNWPERARFWLPTVDDPSYKAPVRFMVEVRDGWRVVANGRAQPCSRREGEQRVLCRWDETRPIPTYTMVIGAGEFTVSKHRPVVNRRDTIPIEVWTYPEDSAFADSVPFRRATEIVEVMQRLIGPFPYEKLAHVQSSTRFGGMENASAIFYAEKPYIERRMREGVVRHETAHQWFGDAVTPRDWPHLWLSEGFATYFDAVIGAALDGDSVLAKGMRANAESYFGSDVTDRPIVDSANAREPMRLLNANSYPKGAWVLHMLRGLMGDSAFFRGVRTYYRTYRDSTATSEDFQEIMETAAGMELGWFFRQWLHQPGYPQLDATWQYDATARRLLVGITQTQKAEWGLFRLPVLTLEFRGAGGEVLRRDVAVVGRQTFPRFDVPFAPTEVRIDPDGKVLLRATIARAAGN